jgi:hypothetical protein
MLPECPTRHRPLRRREYVGARHARRPRRRRPHLCIVAPEGLRGSFDPVWTAGAEGRFLAGALGSPSRHPVIIAGRVLLLVALVAPGLGPVFSVLHISGSAARAALTVGAVAGIALLLGARARRPTSYTGR